MLFKYKTENLQAKTRHVLSKGSPDFLFVNFCLLCLASDSEGLLFAKANQLPVLLEKEKRSLEEEKKKLKCDRRMRDKQFWEYHKVG